MQLLRSRSLSAAAALRIIAHHTQMMALGQRHFQMHIAVFPVPDFVSERRYERDVRFNARPEAEGSAVADEITPRLVPQFNWLPCVPHGNPAVIFLAAIFDFGHQASPHS